MPDPISPDPSPNRYAAPRAEVADVEPAVGNTQPVRVFSAKGRMGRLRFLCWSGMFISIFLLTLISSYVVEDFVNYDMEEVPLVISRGLGVLCLLCMIVIFIVWITLQARLMIQRSHDMGWSDWSVLVLVGTMLLLYIVTAIIVQRMSLSFSWWYLFGVISLMPLVWIIKPGTSGPNRFGPPPAPTPWPVQIGAWIFVVLVVLYIFFLVPKP
jgi:uncharacterized membrane protein YhaH (DUF805 family)